MNTLHKLIVPIALALSGAAARADSFVYVVNGAQQFGTVNLATGSFHAIGPGIPEGSGGLVRGPNGSLLTLTFSGKLDAINPHTGVTTVVGATGLGNCTLQTDPCGPNSASSLGQLGGTVYATDFAQNLYTVDPTTGVATLIGNTGIPALPFIPQSGNPDGTVNVYDESLFSVGGKLYSTFDASTIDFSTFTVTPVIAANLYQIDPLTGVATLLGPTVQALSSIINVNGTTYAFQASTGQELSLDLSNGNTTYITDVDPNAGLITGTSPVPEPGSITLMGTGLAGVIAGLRRRRRKA